MGADVGKKGSDAVQDTHKVDVDHPPPSVECNVSMPLPPPTPALLQTTWTFPNASYDAFAARSTLAGSATSHPTPRTCGLKSCRFSTAAVSASVSISASITFMPVSANVRLSANPMPLAAPVTNAVLPPVDDFPSALPSLGWLRSSLRRIGDHLQSGIRRGRRVTASECRSGRACRITGQAAWYGLRTLTYSEPKSDYSQ
jgi:hypothetical protein